MPPDTRVALRQLARELDVSLDGLTIEQLPVVADRFVADGRLKAEVLRGIVEDVRAEGVDTRRRAVEPQQARPVAVVRSGSDAAPSAHRGYRFNSTEADRKDREKRRLQHQAENARTGLYLVPRRPEPFPAGKPHPACLAAARDGGTPCERCSWLLEDDPYTEAWLDRDD